KSERAVGNADTRLAEERIARTAGRLRRWHSSAPGVVQFRRGGGAARHDESHRFIDCPIEHHEAAGRNQFHVARGRVRRGRDVNGGDLLAGVGVVENPGHEADGFHFRRREFDQHDALRSAGLGLKAGDELPRSAVDGLYDRNSRHQVVKRGEQSASRHGGRDLTEDVKGREHDRDRDRRLKPRRGKPLGERRRMNPQPRYGHPDERTAERNQQPDQETDHPYGDQDGNKGKDSRHDIATDLCEHRSTPPRYALGPSAGSAAARCRTIYVRTTRCCDDDSGRRASAGAQPLACASSVARRRSAIAANTVTAIATIAIATSIQKYASTSVPTTAANASTALTQ